MSKLFAMTEFELKFDIPPGCLKSVAVAVLEGKATRQRLQASYFDTSDGALARHGIVVRLRKEGRRWVQTAKAATTDVLDRLEHNVALTRQPAARLPELDLSRHRETPVGRAIDKALGRKDSDNLPNLLLQYSTDIQRISACVVKNGSVAEVALDQGRVFVEGHSQSICELEVELKEGLPAHAVTLARAWCAEHGLWLSAISKSMKGQRLRGTERFGAAVSAVAPDFPRHASGDAMITAVVQSCLSQILPNASELASGSNNPDHVHQLRVGIRRLRTALRELGDLTDAMDPAWEAVLVQVFQALGRHRDQSHLALTLQPQLLAAGGPEMDFVLPDAGIPDPGEAVRAAPFQDVLLGLAGFVHRDTPVRTQKKTVAADALKKTVSRSLEKLHKRAMRDGKNFLKLDGVRQHGVRKRLKRLRYLLEFSAPLFASRKVSEMTSALKPVQDALGLYNDELMALQAWRALALDDPNAWFGIGWFTARRLPNARRCMKEIKTFAAIQPFWQG